MTRCTWFSALFFSCAVAVSPQLWQRRNAKWVKERKDRCAKLKDLSTKLALLTIQKVAAPARNGIFQALAGRLARRYGEYPLAGNEKIFIGEFFAQVFSRNQETFT